MFCDSYFNDTPPSDWSYLSFLETLKPVFMSTDQDVSLSENSALRKRYRNVLKRIVSEKRDNEQVKVATSLLQKVLNLHFLKQELHSLGGVPFLLRGMGCRSYNVISCFEQLGGCRSYPGDGCRS